MATIETFEKITVDRLTVDSVSILTRTYAMINGEETLLNNHRRAFVNSEQGRADIAEYLAEPNTAYLDAVMALWGDTPTVIIPEVITPEATIPESGELEAGEAVEAQSEEGSV